MKHPIQNWVYYIIILLNSVKLIPLTPHFKLIFHLKIQKKNPQKKNPPKKKKKPGYQPNPKSNDRPKNNQGLVEFGTWWLPLVGNLGWHA